MSPNIDRELCREARKTRNAFLDLLEDVRPDLFRYCRSLTGNVWDAEDLAQESILRAYGRLATQSLLEEIARPRAYLFRIATNTWIDRARRAGRVGEVEDADRLPGPEAPPALEVRDALERVARVLAPRERAVVLLKDVFDFSLAETATFLETTVGAVKAALHRGRSKLREAREAPPPAPAVRHRVTGDAFLDRFVDAFNARDLDRLMALFHEDARAEIVGVLHEDGRDVIRNGSIFHTLYEGEAKPLPAGDPEAEVTLLGDEPVVVLWYRLDEEGGPPRALRDVIRLRVEDGRIRTLRYWYYSPHVLEEVGAALGEPVRDNGYRHRPESH